MSTEHALKAAEAAREAWNYGRGAWPQSSLQERIDTILKLVAALQERRNAIIQVLMWEICKNTADATAEFDRTMLFIEATIKAVKEMENEESAPQVVSGIRATVRRSAIGVMLALGPFNYPVSLCVFSS